MMLSSLWAKTVGIAMTTVTVSSARLSSGLKHPHGILLAGSVGNLQQRVAGWGQLE